jgi:hypothetical protein
MADPAGGRTGAVAGDPCDGALKQSTAMRTTGTSVKTSLLNCR